MSLEAVYMARGRVLARLRQTIRDWRIDTREAGVREKRGRRISLRLCVT